MNAQMPAVRGARLRDVLPLAWLSARNNTPTLIPLVERLPRPAQLIMEVPTLFAVRYDLMDLVILSTRGQALTTEHRQGLLTASWVNHRLAGVARLVRRLALMFVTLVPVGVALTATALLVGLTPAQAVGLPVAVIAVLEGVLVLSLLLASPNVHPRTLLSRRRVPRPYYHVTELVIDRPHRGRASGVYTALVNEALCRGAHHRAVAPPADQRLAARYRELGFVDVPDSGDPPLMVREPDPTPAADRLAVHNAHTSTPTAKE